jgi:hypothetical protein
VSGAQEAALCVGALQEYGLVGAFLEELGVPTCSNLTPYFSKPLDNISKLQYFPKIGGVGWNRLEQTIFISPYFF